MGTANMLLGAAGPFLFTSTISTNQVDYNLYNAMVAAGWDQQKPVVVQLTINSSVVIYASSNTVSAFTVGTLPANSSVTITNNGYIVGKGGQGVGKGYPTNSDYNLTAPASANGGTAFTTTSPVSINNASGVIGGGGGGGGAGGATGADCKCSGCGGVGLAGMGVGGGGAGFGDAGTGAWVWRNNTQYFDFRTSSAGDATNPGANYVSGGTGGSLGQAGGTGSGSSYCGYTLQSGPGTGGAAGACTSGNSNITWLATGSRYGALN
jgi:hypothetical protein